MRCPNRRMIRFNWEVTLMDRRSFIRAGAIGTAATALAAPAIAQGNITWRMVTTWPKNFPGLGVGAQRLADRITAASGGRLTIQVYSAGELVPPLQSLDAVIDGTAEMSHGAAYYWQNKSTALSFFTGVPYGMTTAELGAWVRFMGGQEIWDEIYDQFGVQGFLSGNTGNQTGGWFREELTGLADIQGKRFRTPGLGGRVWEKMGATVTNMAGGEIFQALQSGTLDAAEFVGPYNDLALGFHQVAKHYYLSSFVEPGLATEIVVDKAKYQELPDDLQALVRDVAQAEYEMVSSDFIANDPRALQTLINDHGVQVHQFPDDIMEAGAKGAKELIEELRADSDPLVQKTTESYIEALKLVRSRTEQIDMPYQQARKSYFDL
ncbi:TRAP-type mannitol/chloroaromatic compound transport system, substrate-binding protein [Roseovarius nanhaiticus]|uniref:TRAP-type mannitol/chloroaromatic compound transport system, substrate-binding protein n=2 Tax=Roseovarius nanhaiticus TaxID=573024 RepID=A0A1N7H704_9RHOB|nr:TRAP-type mannitol/chloroaromatic compound transport system, substrate-binding protein [Roseovarius nanhaiticus]SIS20438.1 TRAP-type mannitol/chloroaromatic compound transport system, substrate-binding protein [Roseovarius nanhaiticus]